MQRFHGCTLRGSSVARHPRQMQDPDGINDPALLENLCTKLEEEEGRSTLQQEQWRGPGCAYLNPTRCRISQPTNCIVRPPLAACTHILNINSDMAGGKKRPSSSKSSKGFWDTVEGWKAVEAGDDFLLGAEQYGFAGLEMLDASALGALRFMLH